MRDAELAATPYPSPLTAEEVASLRAIGDNTGGMAIAETDDADTLARICEGIPADKCPRADAAAVPGANKEQ